MRLLRPSPGECVDRRTILQIKMRKAVKLGANCKHFADEDQQLQSYLESIWLQNLADGTCRRVEKFSLELQKVNEALWDLENRIRQLRSLSDEKRRERTEEIVSVALAIPELNDERARLVAAIDSLFGINGQEKLYST